MSKFRKLRLELITSASTKNQQGSQKKLLDNIGKKNRKKNQQTTTSIKKYKINSFFQFFKHINLQELQINKLAHKYRKNIDI